MAISKLPTSASLKQVIDKFEEISLADFSNIDVVVKSELPNEVKNGQIVVITDTYNNIIFQADKKNYTFEENDIFIRLLPSLNKKFTIGKSKKINMYVFGAEKFTNGSWQRICSYIGIDNAWISMNALYLLERDKTSKYVDMYETKSTGASYKTQFNADHFFVQMITTPGSGSPTVQAYIGTKELQQTSSFNKLLIRFKGSGQAYIKLVDEVGNELVRTMLNPNTETLKEIDITNIDVDCYIRYTAEGTHGKISGTAYIYDCWME